MQQQPQSASSAAASGVAGTAAGTMSSTVSQQSTPPALPSRQQSSALAVEQSALGAELLAAVRHDSVDANATGFDAPQVQMELSAVSGLSELSGQASILGEGECC